MYQIFVDRFYNGDPTNDVESREYIYIGAPCESDGLGRTSNGNGCAAVLRRRLAGCS